ncbi:hypothetical protein RRG08_045309 [Elysia crispata]|uniref:Uncharacterized protein n=1 Tax=Elysia crispata TaxID=231223 RepID=A0AAE1DQW9_9GAST|nr:hypothetical protein RRG08_045309 [Elysia crispata]
MEIAQGGVRERDGDSTRWRSEKDMEIALGGEKDMEIALGGVRERHGDSARWRSEKDMEIALGGGQRKTWR